jgi:mannosyltransferase OCH1-like enzyme
LKLFQFWDRPPIPDDVVEWTSGFRDHNPEFDYHLFDEAEAITFIAQHYGAREVAAFETCAVPAMKADLFRLCAMDACGGVYADADLWNRAPLRSLISQVDQALLLVGGEGLINNGFMFVREPANPFMRACLALALENIEARRFASAVWATGPGIFMGIIGILESSTAEPADSRPDHFDLPPRSAETEAFYETHERARQLIEPTPELVSAWAGFTRMDISAARSWIGQGHPAYKLTDRHWVNWQGAIYR